MLAFKGFTHRWLAAVTQVAPYTTDKILPVLNTSAAAAIKQCKGGPSGTFCGFYWADGQSAEVKTGAGEQMNILSAVSNLLIGDAPGPATSGSPPSSPGTGSGGGGLGTGTTGAPPPEGSNKSLATSARVTGGMVLGAIVGLGMVWLSL